jgi:hypothetical protein
MGTPLHAPPQIKIHQSNPSNQSINHQKRLYTWAHRSTPSLKYKIHQSNLGNLATNHQEKLFTPHFKSNSINQTMAINQPTIRRGCTRGHTASHPASIQIPSIKLCNQSTNHQERLYTWAHCFTPRLNYKIHLSNLWQSVNHQEGLYTWAHLFTHRLKKKINQSNLGNQSTNRQRGCTCGHTFSHTASKIKTISQTFGNQSTNHQERLYTWAHRFTPNLTYKNHQSNLW